MLWVKYIWSIFLFIFTILSTPGQGWTGTKKNRPWHFGPDLPTSYDQNATHLCMPLNTYSNSYSIRALKPYIIAIECICCFILHMPIAQLPLPEHFHHIHNTLQWSLFLTCSLWVDWLCCWYLHLSILGKKLQHMFVYNALFMLLYAQVNMSPIWHSSNEYPVVSLPKHHTHKTMHDVSHNMWATSCWFHPYRLIPPAQLDVWYSVVGGNLKIFVNQKV